MPKPQQPRFSDEPTTELVVGMVADARDLALVHLNRLQRELRSDLRNLGDLLKARLLTVGGLLVAMILAALALAFGLVDALGIPLWGSLGAVSLAIVAASLYGHRRASRPTREIDLVPDDALADAKRDVQKLVRSTEQLTAD
jgi:hypothetical protein